MMSSSVFWVSLLINLTIISLLTFGLKKYYRNKPKVDKGFKFAYFGLSYRRKFLRTFYSIPFFLLLIVFMYFLLGLSPLFIGYVIFVVIIFIVQVSYNYVKWQEEKKSV